VFPDPDSYGAQNALKSIIEATYPNKSTLWTIPSNMYSSLSIL
jgi:nanoRNase/pAp phosphatase (c-di-AMP/oligoRNAs hydrolase)